MSHADRVTFEYFGTTTSVFQAPALFPNVQAGDDFSFIFTFDPTTPNSATQTSDEFTRGGYGDAIEAARLTFGDEQAEPGIRNGSISITDRPGSGQDFFQVVVEFDNNETFLFELEDGPGLDSADLPTSPPAVAGFGPDNGGEYNVELSNFNFVQLLDVQVLGERQLDPDFLLVDNGNPPDQGDGGSIGGGGSNNGGSNGTSGGGTGGGSPVPVRVIPTPAAALMGLPLMLGLAVRRGVRSARTV
ncbi:MAG: hypothetical protein AAF710_11015 [Planctomycetota bacterium]